MKVLALMSSALGENSAGRATFRKVLEHSEFDKEHEVREVILNRGKLDDIISDVKWCDLLIVIASPFHFGIQAQAKRKFISMAETKCFENKLVTFFISSGGGGDQILEKELEALFKGFNSIIIPGYSCIDYAIFENQGKKSSKNERSGNNIDDMSIWLKSLVVNDSAIESYADGDILILKITEDEEYYNSCKYTIKKYYPNAKEIDVMAKNYNDCIGCKLCYTVKKQCIYKDNYIDEITATTEKAKKVFYISDFIGETLSPHMDNTIQRSVSSGLYPNVYTPRHNIYMFKTNGASTEAVDIVRLHFEMLNSMEMEWYNIYFNDSFYDEVYPKSEHTDEKISRFAYDMARQDYQIKSSAYPNITGWTRMYIRHFARLCNMIKNLLPNEYKFYNKHPMARFVETDENIKPILSKESLKTSAKFKIAAIEEFDSKNYKINEKRSFLSFLFSKK